MKIDFTKQEYKTLLDLVSLADSVLYSFDTDEEEKAPEHKALIQKIFSNAKDADFADIVSFSKEVDEYVVEDNYFDESIMPFLEEYDEQKFWEMLIHQMAMRDALQKYGEEEVEKMELKDKFDAFNEQEEKWDTEFREQGLRRLVVKE